MTELSFGDVLFWLAPGVGFVVHFTLGRYNARRVVEQWQSLPAALDSERLGALRSQVETDAATLEIALDSARQARESGDSQEAVRLAALAHKIVAETTPDRLSRLSLLSKMLRMSLAVSPLPPLQARAFHLGRLASLSGLAAALHHLLVSPAERVLLRVHVLRAGFRMVIGVLDRCVDQMTRRPAVERTWRRLEAGASDFKTLDREHLDTARACLVSLRFEPRVQIIPQRAR
jgi:hypothetical protein